MNFLTTFVLSLIILLLPVYSLDNLHSLNLSEVDQSNGLTSSKPPQRKLKEFNRIDDNTFNEMCNRLDFKADTLVRELSRARESLGRIADNLSRKAKELKDTNLRAASLLARYFSGIMMAASSTDGILHNIKVRDYSQRKCLQNIGLAICASGALRDQFEQIIKYLSESGFNDDIDLQILREVSESVHSITKDIENPLLSY